MIVPIIGSLLIQTGSMYQIKALMSVLSLKHFKALWFLSIFLQCCTTIFLIMMIIQENQISITCISVMKLSDYSRLDTVNSSWILWLTRYRWFDWFWSGWWCPESLHLILSLPLKLKGRVAEHILQKTFHSTFESFFFSPDFCIIWNNQDPKGKKSGQSIIITTHLINVWRFGVNCNLAETRHL